MSPTETPTERLPVHRYATERDLRDLEERVDEQEKRLNSGDTSFALVRKDIEILTASINALRVTIEAAANNSIGRKIMDSLVQWGVPLTAIGILWALAHAGAIPGVRPA